MYLKKSLVTALVATSLFAGSAYAANITAVHYIDQFSQKNSGHVIGSFSGVGKDFVFTTPAGGKITEYDDGTATFTGTVKKVNKNGTDVGNGDYIFNIDIRLSGKTDTPPSKPKAKCAKSSSSCTYYPVYESAVLTGEGQYDGVVIELSPRGPAFQIGVGANAKDGDFGGSSWFNWKLVSDPNNVLKGRKSGKGDFNFDIVPCQQNCLVYALHDGGLNDSQLFTIDPDNGYSIAALGPEYPGYDLEGLAITPDGSTLYASSGDDATAAPTAELYEVNKVTGALTSIGNTGFGEVSALSVRPSDNTLWGWAEGEGIITIDTNTGLGSMMVPNTDAQVEDMAWSVDGETLYGSDNTMLWAYTPSDGNVNVICMNLPGQTEAIEAYSDEDTLLFAIHQADDLSIYALDIASCEVTSTVVMETGYYDIEGIGWAVR